MTQLSADLLAAGQGLFSDSATSQANLGARAVSGGRSYRYVKAGAVALVPGKLQQSAAEITDHQDLTPTAATAIGATQITVTLGATAATADQYSGGYAVITTSTGAGYQYQISSNPAANGSATLTLTLTDPIIVATATSSRVDLYPNPYNGVIVNPASATSAPVGVGVYAVTALYYGWIQVGGAATILSDGGATVGTAQVASNGTAGAVEAATGIQAPVCTAITGVASTEYGLFKLRIE